MIWKLWTGILWLPLIAIHFALLFFGLVAVPLALSTRELTVSATKEEQLKHWPDLLWVWGNDEEGCPSWWRDLAKKKGGFIAKFPQFWWYAVRNPINNFRFLFKEPEYVTVQTNAPNGLEARDLIAQGLGVGYRWTRSGWMSGYRRVWLNGNGKYSEFWIGWKLGSTVPGLGFTTQLRLNRKIGT